MSGSFHGRLPKRRSKAGEVFLVRGATDLVGAAGDDAQEDEGAEAHGGELHGQHDVCTFLEHRRECVSLALR